MHPQMLLLGIKGFCACGATPCASRQIHYKKQDTFHCRICRLPPEGCYDGSRRDIGGECFGRKLGTQSFLKEGHSFFFDVFSSTEIMNQHAFADSNAFCQLIQTDVDGPGTYEGSQASFHKLVLIVFSFSLLFHVPAGTSLEVPDVPAGTS